MGKIPVFEHSITLRYDTRIRIHTNFVMFKLTLAESFESIKSVLYYITMQKYCRYVIHSLIGALRYTNLVPIVYHPKGTTYRLVVTDLSMQILPIT